VDVKDAQVARMPCAELAVIIDSHHATPVERPVQTNGAMMPFLSKQA
jgi:pimeloyl-ACP methyl ester carboxylesterase